MDSKIHLSDFERELLYNSEWILTKNNIMKKAQQLLGVVQENISDYTNTNSKIFPEQVAAVPPKISKGENYLGLPWLMLDYPRYFDKENFFAIRTMFWWGNFFSTTLHLSGKFKKIYSEKIASHYEELKSNEFYLCINEDQWHHHLEVGNYKPVKDFSPTQLKDAIMNNSFLKLAKKIPLSDWDHAIDILSNEFVRITGMLH